MHVLANFLTARFLSSSRGDIALVTLSMCDFFITPLPYWRAIYVRVWRDSTLKMESVVGWERDNSMNGKNDSRWFPYTPPSTSSIFLNNCNAVNLTVP